MALYGTLIGQLNIFEWVLIALSLYLLQTVKVLVSSMLRLLLKPFAVPICVSLLTSPTYSRALVGPRIKAAPSLCHIQIPTDGVRSRAAEEVWILVRRHSA